MRGQAGFFDVEERLTELSAKGDALERLSAVVDFASGSNGRRSATGDAAFCSAAGSPVRRARLAARACAADCPPETRWMSCGRVTRRAGRKSTRY
jgi:hypothetical protein